MWTREVWLGCVVGEGGRWRVGDLPISDENSHSPLVLLPGLFVAKSHFCEIKKMVLETHLL